MRLCYVWDADYPWDIRTSKITERLAEDGNEVHLVCRNVGGRPRSELRNGVHIHRLPFQPWGRLGLAYAATFPFFLNPLWLLEIARTCRRHAVDVLIVRDLPLSVSGVWVGRRLGISVVLDLAENYPAMLRDLWADRGPTLLNRVVRNPGLAVRIERYALRRANGVWVVADESGERIIGLGVPSERVTLVGNTPPSASAELASVGRERESEAGQATVRFVYLGLLDTQRGILSALEGFRRLRDRWDAWHFDIIGSGGDAHEIDRAISRLALGDFVTCHGWIDHDRAMTIVRRSDVGVIPHHATEHWNTTLPNKLFDYMAAGIPVLSSDTIPVKRTVNGTGCGLIYRDRDHDDFARQAMQLAKPAVRHRLGSAGRSAIVERYNWELDAERMHRSLVNILDGAKSNAVG